MRLYLIIPVGREQQCLMKPDSRPCGWPVIRYFYNVKTGSCVAFYFGGCHGNANNFASRGDCEERCKGTDTWLLLIMDRKSYMRVHLAPFYLFLDDL